MIFLRWKTFIITLIGLTLLGACKDIVVKVGKKEKSGVVAEVERSSSDSDAAIQPREAEFFLFNLDNLRNTSSEKLVERLEDNWRLLFRREFRLLRDRILATAERKHSYQDGIYFNVSTECSELKKSDLHSYSGLDYLPNLLEGSMLAFLNSEDAKKLNPDLDSALDISAHLILFELGMRGEGWSEVIEEKDRTISKSSILWKVDPEVQDTEEDRRDDSISVAFDFARSTKGGIPDGFSLNVRVGEGVFDNAPKGPQYRLELANEWDYPEFEGSKFISTVRIYKDEVVQYSRQLSMKQTTKVSQVFMVEDKIRYGLAGESSRKVTVDFQKLQKCAEEHSQILVPGVVGMPQKQATELLESLSFTTLVVEDLTGGDSQATVRAQRPQAGSTTSIGNEVQLILDWPQDNLFDQIGEESAEQPEPEPEPEVAPEEPSDSGAEAPDTPENP